MIRKVLFAILLAHSALVSQGKPSRIILQSPPVDIQQVTPQVPAQTLSVIQPPPLVTTSGSTTNPPLQTSAGTTNTPQTVTSAPGTTSSASQTVTSAPLQTSAGTTNAPQVTSNTVIIPAPITPAPVTPAPVTPVPTTPLPTTSLPTTASPTTAAPTLAPLPAGFEYGAWGQVCQIPPNDQDCMVKGQVLQSSAINNRGILNCDRTADCCKCGVIQCGIAPGSNSPIEPHGCQLFSAGDYAAFGVKQVVVLGNPASGPGGAQIECSGISSCQDMNLFGDSITQLMCNVQNSCQGATIQIDNPADGFFIDCNGPESCKNAKITVNIGTAPPPGSQCNPQYINERRFGGIICNAMNSCDGLELTVNNRGCDSVILENLNLDQVTGASFNFNGNVEIENCVCGPTCNFASGLGKCFQNLESLICPDVRSCMNMVKTIINPMDMFYLECSNELSCAMADITIDLEQTALSMNPLSIPRDPVRFIQSLSFGGINSGRGATIHIHNHQLIDPQMPGMPVIVTIGILECSAMNSCRGLTIFTGDNVNIMHRICGSFEACDGCMIKKDEFDVGIPCNPMTRPPQIPQFIPQQFQASPQGQPQFVPRFSQPQFVPQV